MGKSTLFNRLVGKKNAIVGDMPGITRDRKVVDADFFGVRVRIIDTPGVDTFSKDDQREYYWNKTLKRKVYNLYLMP